MAMGLRSNDYMNGLKEERGLDIPRHRNGKKAM